MRHAREVARGRAPGPAPTGMTGRGQDHTLDRMSDPTPWLDEEQQEVWQALLAVIIALPTVLDRQLQKDAGISNFEYSVMARLSMTEGTTMRLSDLAQRCNSTQPRLSKLVDRFAARGWVERRPDPDDGRYTLASLTDAGMEEVVACAPGHVALVRRLVVDPLSAAQLRHLGAALERVTATVSREMGDG